MVIIVKCRNRLDLFKLDLCKTYQNEQRRVRKVKV